MNKFARLVILTDNIEKANQFTWYLNRLKFNPVLVVVENTKQSIKKRLKQRLKKYGLGPTLFWILRVIDSKIETKPIFDKPVKFGALLSTNSVNSEETIESVKKAKPKIIINLTSSILSKKILAQAKNRVFGVHPGRLPRYVALSSIEWQIYDGNVPEFTIFSLNEEIDSGRVYLQKPVKPKKNETLSCYRNRFIDQARQTLAQFVAHNYLRFQARPIILPKEEPLNRGLFPINKYLALIEQWQKLSKQFKR